MQKLPSGCSSSKRKMQMIVRWENAQEQALNCCLLDNYGKSCQVLQHCRNTVSIHWLLFWLHSLMNLSASKSTEDYDSLIDNPIVPSLCESECTEIPEIQLCECHIVSYGDSLTSGYIDGNFEPAISWSIVLRHGLKECNSCKYTWIACINDTINI
jgi:hypothetical protein